MDAEKRIDELIKQSNEMSMLIGYMVGALREIQKRNILEQGDGIDDLLALVDKQMTTIYYSYTSSLKRTK